MSDPVLVSLAAPDGRRIEFVSPVRHGWHARSVPGWDGLSGMRNPPQERAFGHGAYSPGRVYRRAKTGAMQVTFHGSAETSYQARTLLAGLCAESELILTLRDHGQESTRMVYIDTADIPNPHAPCERFTATLDWVAADPRRYGPPITPATQQVPIGGTESNLLTNPSFALNAGGWFGTAQGSTTEYPLARVSHPYDGWLGRIVTGSGAAGLAAGTRIDLGGATVTDVLVDVVGSVATSLRLSLTWLDAAGRALRTDLGAETAAAAYATVRLAMPVTPPAGAARLTLIVDGYGSPWAAGSWLGVHRALVGTATDYRDGDSPGWVWGGRPGASASRKAGVTWLLDNSAGTADSVPLLQFTPSAPLSGFMVSQSGHGSLQWSGQVIPAGTLVTVDTRGHQVLLNGRLPERRWSGEFPIVEAGETTVLTLSTPGVAASATCTWSPAWW